MKALGAHAVAIERFILTFLHVADALIVPACRAHAPVPGQRGIPHQVLLELQICPVLHFEMRCRDHGGDGIGRCLAAVAYVLQNAALDPRIKNIVAFPTELRCHGLCGLVVKIFIAPAYHSKLRGILGTDWRRVHYGRAYCDRHHGEANNKHMDPGQIGIHSCLVDVVYSKRGYLLKHSR